MFNSIKTRASALLASSVLFSTDLMAAGLPTVSAPSRTTTGGNYVELLQNYAFDIGILVGLILSTVGFIMVARNVIGVYAEIGDGRKTWGDMAAQASGGVLLLVLIVFLLAEAATVL